MKKASRQGSRAAGGGEEGQTFGQEEWREKGRDSFVLEE